MSISCTYLYNHFCFEELICIVMEFLESIQCYTILCTKVYLTCFAYYTWAAHAKYFSAENSVTL